MNRLLTVTLNAAVDKTFEIPQFVPGAIHHVSRADTSPGGKGVNVARVAQALGADVVTTGFAGGYNGEYIVGRLAEMGLNPDFVRIAQESRVCTDLVESRFARDTKINEVGPLVTNAECDAVLAKLGHLAGSFEWVALCGRMPPGSRQSLYSEAIHVIRSAGAKAALDTSGQTLVSGLTAKPDLCKVNAQELGDALSVSDLTLSSLANATRAISGVEFVVTLGPNGAAWLPDCEVGVPQVRLVSAVGAGDAFLAGLLVALMRGLSRVNALRYAVCVGASACEQFGAGVIDVAQVNRFLTVY